MFNNQIVVLGAGNVATNLAVAIKKYISPHIHIHGRNEQNAKQLAELIKGSFSTRFDAMPSHADLYVLCVNDDAVFDLAKNRVLKEKIGNALTVHTAGSIPMQSLKNLSDNYGVFYPLQTFSKHKIIELSNIPLCIEANSESNLHRLRKYALQLSTEVRNINSEQRKYLHLAAVFANNFANAMFHISETILNEQNIDFDLLIPLIEETANKIKTAKPSASQTGPAIRNDKKIMEMHLDLLKDKANLQMLYKLIGKQIRENSIKNERPVV